MKTVIWHKNAAGKMVVRETYKGLPYGIPKNGTLVNIFGLGEAICTLETSVANEAVHTVTLTLVWGALEQTRNVTPVLRCSERIPIPTHQPEIDQSFANQGTQLLRLGFNNHF